MKEKFGASNLWDQQETFEKRTIGSLTYTVEPQRIGPAVLNFGTGFLIGGRFGDEHRDFRDQIAYEARTIRTDSGLMLPETAALEEGEGGLVFFTLPESGLRGVISELSKKDKRLGRYQVQIATPEAVAAEEKRLRQEHEDVEAEQLPEKRRIERLVEQGRDDEAKNLAIKSVMHWVYRDAVERRDQKKTDE